MARCSCNGAFIGGELRARVYFCGKMGTVEKSIRGYYALLYNKIVITKCFEFSSY